MVSAGRVKIQVQAVLSPAPQAGCGRHPSVSETWYDPPEALCDRMMTMFSGERV